MNDDGDIVGVKVGEPVFEINDKLSRPFVVTYIDDKNDKYVSYKLKGEPKVLKTNSQLRNELYKNGFVCNGVKYCRTTIDFDRNDVRGLAKKLQKECDNISSKLDLIELTTDVEFTPKWDVNDTLEEIITSNKS